MDKKTVRDEIERLFAQEVLGPRAMDEVLDARPSDIYLTGILWPRGTEGDAEEDDGGTEIATDEAEPGEGAIPGYRAIRPCSIGLTFETDIDTRIVVSLGTTARYRPSTGSGGTDPAECPSDAQQDVEWRRVQLNYRAVVDAGELRTHWRIHDFLTPDGNICNDPGVGLDIRRRLSGERVVVTATLINTSPEAPLRSRDATLLFQSELRVESVKAVDRPAIRPRLRYPHADDEDQLTNLLLYRDAREFAAGHGVAANWMLPTEDRVREVFTSWLPRTSVKGTNPSGHASLKPLQSRSPSPFAAATLADLGHRVRTCDELDELCHLYEDWIGALSARSKMFTGTLYEAAVRNIDRCTHALTRMRKGVDILRSANVAWEAFTLANRAMDLQARFPARGPGARALVWRPFQLAFVLLVIPGLVAPEDDDACRDTMDLLWFPTGGGKTEAYLCLTAFEIFRLRLTDESRRRSGGTDVLMRYTLRLLTIQQFQRAAAVITACEMMRQREPARLGTAPISLGLYVGADSTPNRLSEAAILLQEEAGGRKPHSTPRQLLTCPVCNTSLTTTAYRIDPNRTWMDITCPAQDCPVHAMPLPILTVDEAIYAHPPSLIIATVDKFAQLPRNGAIRNLFAHSGQRLGLIVQDELHLISGPLGSMAGLYEAAIDLLCADGNVRPKIIGSTATIGRAARQVRALFDRDVLQFPPPGFDASDSFFAVRDEGGDDRLYCGVSSAGRSPKFALQAVLAALLQTTQALRSQGSAPDSVLDPYWTCVAYFNSLRELGGAHVMMLDDVRRQIAVLASRSGIPARPFDELPRELSSRVASRQIPEILQELNHGLESTDPYQSGPVDTVLASNMISVGVDVPRLGLMVLAGQPKSTAEYIQATSRVGRGLPGLVVTLYNFGRPRDLSHFEHFPGYHQALYFSVEATSVTPWAPRARDKALHAVFAAIVRHLVTGMNTDDSAIAFSAADASVRSVVDYLIRRARNATQHATDSDIRRELDEIARDWERRASNARAAGKKFNYWEKPAPFGRTSPHLLYSAEQMLPAGSSAWAAPNSLREVEPSTAFVLRKHE